MRDDRATVVAEILQGLEKVDIDPGMSYGLTTMKRPKDYVTRGEYAYAYGPDGFIWIADIENGNYIDWSDAGPLYQHLEYFYGEMFKLRLMDDDQLLTICAVHLAIIRELQMKVLAG
jgi:hypothetical protein